MCDTCGCGSAEGATTFRKPGNEGHPGEPNSDQSKHNHNHHHDHAHDHTHSHDPSYPHSHSHDHEHHSHEKTIELNTDIMGRNNLLAERNRGYFEAKKIKSLNLVSSPGSGKTTLLEKTIEKIKTKHPVSVIEGDQQTMNDAERINRTGVPVIQVNTGNGCHLDAAMINRAVKELTPKENSFLFIENVGNLVCPSLFDLGEAKRIVIISVTEGEDKPVKYPNMFHTSHLCIINKIDLLPYVDFDLARMKKYALQVNSNLEFIELSAKTGEGMKNWIDWLNKV